MDCSPHGGYLDMGFGRQSAIMAILPGFFGFTFSYLFRVFKGKPLYKYGFFRCVHLADFIFWILVVGRLFFVL